MSRRCRGAGRDAGCRRKACGRRVLVDAIEHRKRYVERIGREDVGGRRADGVLAFSALAPLGEVAQRAKAALADHLVGRLDDRAEDAADLAVFCPNGAVGEREVGFFGVAAAIDVQQEIARSRWLALPDHLRQHRVDDVPDLRATPRGRAGPAPRTPLPVPMICCTRRCRGSRGRDPTRARWGTRNRGRC